MKQRKKVNRRIVLMVASLVLFSSTICSVQANETSEVIVMMQPETDAAYIPSFYGTNSVSVLEQVQTEEGVVCLLETTGDVQQTITTLQENENVLYAEENQKIQLHFDYDYGRQWGLKNSGQPITIYPGVQDIDIGIEAAWKTEKGIKSITVALLDTGVDIQHEDLQENIYQNEKEIAGDGIDNDNNGFIDDRNGWDFCDNDATVSHQGTDSDGNLVDLHGTHVAGIIGAATNGIGVQGVAQHVSLLPIRILRGGDGGYLYDAIRAVHYAKQMGADIVNCSWGMYTESLILKEIMRASDMLFVCAAGNDAQNMNVSAYKQYPAAYDLDNIITVAAITNRGELASFSNTGDVFVDIAAPGRDIYSTVPGNGYAYLSGTSMAAPFVSATAALLMSSAPDMCNEEIVDIIKKSVLPLEGLSGKVGSGGMVRADRALNRIAAPPSDAAVQRYGAGITAADETLYSAGGYTNEYLDTVSRYHPDTGTWDALPSMLEKRADHALAIVGNRLYAFGGFNGSEPTRSAEVLDLSSDALEWRPIEPIPKEKYGMGCAVIGTQIYLIGGIDKSGYSNMVYAYDTESDTWSVIAALPEVSAFCAATEANGNLYLFGGIDETGCRNQTLCYRPVDNSWSTCASMPGYKMMANVVPYQGNLYVLGGMNGTVSFKGDPFLQAGTAQMASFSKAVWEYQPDANIWTVLQDIETPRIGGSSVLWNGHISQIGGWNGSYEVPSEHYLGLFAPKHLSARTMNYGSYEVSWDAVKGAAEYELEINGIVMEPTTSPVFYDSYGNEEKRTYRVRTLNDLGQPGVWSEPIHKFPNGDIDDAKPYVPGTTIQDTLSTDYQYKWYQIDTQESGELTLTLSDIPEGCTYKMLLCNAAGQAVEEAEEVDGNLVIDSFTISCDPYYIELYAFQGSSAQPYTLSSTLRTIASSDIPTRLFTNLAEGSHTRQMMVTTANGEQITWEEGMELPEIQEHSQPTAIMASGSAGTAPNDDTEELFVSEEEPLQPLSISSDPRELYNVKYMSATLASATKITTHQFSIDTNNIPYGKKGKVIVEFDEKDEHNYFLLEWNYSYGPVQDNFAHFWNDGDKSAWVTGVVERGQGTQSFQVKVSSKEYSPDAANYDYTLKAYLLIGDANDEDYSGTENWGITTATSVSVDSVKDSGTPLTITRKLDFKHDRDYYKVRLNQGDKITIATTNPQGFESTLNGYGVNIVNGAHVELAGSLDSSENEKDLTLTYIVPQTGTYYIYVLSPIEYYQATAHPYTLEIYCTTAAVYDSFEFNDSLISPPLPSQIQNYIGTTDKTARTISFGFDNPDDQDNFAVAMETGDKITVELKKRPGNDWSLEDFDLAMYLDSGFIPPIISPDDYDKLGPVYIKLKNGGDLAINSMGEQTKFATWVVTEDSTMLVRVINTKHHQDVSQPLQFDLTITKTSASEQDQYEITYQDSFWHDAIGMPMEQFSNDYMKISTKTSVTTGKPVYDTTAYNMTGTSSISQANLDNELDIDWYRINTNITGSGTKKISLSSSITNAEDNYTVVLANADSNILVDRAVGGVIKHNFEANTDYFIGVTTKNWENIKSNPVYSLSVTNASNDDISDAQQLHLGNNENYSLGYSNQKRYFKFTTGDAGSYMVSATGNSFDLSGWLYDTDGKTVLCRVENMHTFGLAHTLKANTQYYICLTGADTGYGQFSVNVKRLDEPTDRYFDKQWYLQNWGQTVNNDKNVNPVPKNEIKFGLDINALPAWEYATGKGVKVSIIEEGCKVNHEDLDKQYVVNDLPEEPKQHGTVIAGEIAAKRNGVGIVGLAFDSKLVLLHRKGGSTLDITDQITGIDILEQIKMANDKGAKIVNMSFFLSTNDKKDDIEELRLAMGNLTGMLFVLAAGNTSDSAENYFMQHYGLANTIVVANYQQDGALYRKSSRGDYVDIAAPGTDIYSTMYSDSDIVEGGRSSYGFDTDGAASYAAPLVTATAALLLERYPNLSGIDMKNIITASADISDKISSNDVPGSRILNTYSALVYAEQYQGSVRAMTVEPMQKMDKNKINLDAYSYETNQMYLQFADNDRKDEVLEQLRQINGAQGMEIVDYYDFIDCYKVELPQNISRELVTMILENENVTYAVSNLHFVQITD